MSELYEVGRLYERSRKLDLACSWLFWANCALTVLVLWPKEVQAIIVYLQIATAVAHVALGLMNDVALWFDAESANRKHLIEDAFGIDITGRRSLGYYNNRFDRSLERYVTNAFESTYFTMSVSGAMIPTRIAKSVTAFLLFVLMLFLRPTGISLSDATQAVFSTYLIEDAILLIVFNKKVRDAYERFYEALISMGVSSRTQMVMMLANVQEYECIKAYFKVKVDSGKFVAMNEDLSNKWAEIEGRIRFNYTDADNYDSDRHNVPTG